MNNTQKTLVVVMIGGIVARGIVYAITKKRRDKIDADIKKSIDNASEMSQEWINETFPKPKFDIGT